MQNCSRWDQTESGGHKKLPIGTGNLSGFEYEAV